MPVKKRTDKARRLDPWKEQELRHGPCLLSGLGYWPECDYGEPPGAMVDDWSRHGAAITAAWIAERPGTRPWAWWWCEHPDLAARGPAGGALYAELTQDPSADLKAARDAEHAFLEHHNYLNEAGA